MWSMGERYTKLWFQVRSSCKLTTVKGFKKLTFWSSVSPSSSESDSWNSLETTLKIPCLLHLIPNDWSIAYFRSLMWRILFYGSIKIRLALLTHRVRGPFLETPETYRAYFGSYNFIRIPETKKFPGMKFCNNRISGSQFLKWLFGSEKFTELLRNGPQVVRKPINANPKINQGVFSLSPNDVQRWYSAKF